MPLAVRLCTCVVVAALCGSVVAMAAPLPQKVFVARGNGYCSAYYVKLNRLPTPKTLIGLAERLRAQRPYLVTLGRQLASLAPPPENRARYTAMLSVLHAEFPVADGVITAATHGDGARIRSLVGRLITMDKHYDALANSVGLTVCGQPTSH